MYFRELIESGADWQRFETLLGNLSTFLEDFLRKLVIPSLDVAISRASRQPQFFHVTAWMLVRHVISSIDGVSVLVAKGCAENCGPLLRSALEAQTSLAYILQADSERRGLAYQLAHQHRKIKFLKACDPCEQKGQAIRAELADDPFRGLLDCIPVDPKKQVTILEGLFTRPEYAPIEAEWQRLRKKTNKDPDWYTLFSGPRSVRELSKVVGQLSMYEFLYRHWSNVVHAGSGMENLARGKEGQVTIKPIRHPEDLQPVCRIAGSLCLSVSGALLRAFAPDDIAKLQQLYVSELRPRFHELLDKELIRVPWR